MVDKVKMVSNLFISAPFIKCPKCTNKTFGVLSIEDNQYTRKCKKCLYPQQEEPDVIYALPELNKKIIYIDQNAISDMMKSLNPEAEAFKQGRIDNFWKELFIKLDKLRKMQLIVCPASFAHFKETKISNFPERLKRDQKELYEHLACGIRFRLFREIKAIQICEHAKNWLSACHGKKINTAAHSVIKGVINVWQEKNCSLKNIEYNEVSIALYKERRRIVCDKLRSTFSRWKAEKNRDFAYWYNEESMSFGSNIIWSFRNCIKEIAEEKFPFGFLMFEALEKPEIRFFIMIQNEFRHSGVEEKELYSKVEEYLTSPYIKDIPFNKISSMMWAALARRAAHQGRKRTPDEGFGEDIEFISVLLPYCDAMFIDKECHSFLMEKPLVDELKFGSKIFSQRNRNEFMFYLDKIEKSASKDHMTKVYEVYGKDGIKANTDIFMETI